MLHGRLQLSLNLRGLPFPAQQAPAQRALVQERLFAILWPTGLPALQAKLAGLDDGQWEFLSERWLQEPIDLRHGDALLLVAADETRDWLLTGEDHLRLGLRGREAQLRAGAGALDAASHALDEAAGLALGPAGERLVANPFLCGSGCHGALVLHLPALAWWGQVEDHLDPLYGRGLSYRTWQEGFGDFLVLENMRGDAWPLADGDVGGESSGPAQRTLDSLLGAASELHEAEQAARSQLKRHRRLEVEDRVHRAQAACRSARLMGYPELVEHVSLMRLGCQLAGSGWHLPDFAIPVSTLLLNLAPAHLAARSEADRDGRQTSALRARLLRAALAG